MNIDLDIDMNSDMGIAIRHEDEHGDVVRQHPSGKGAMECREVSLLAIRYWWRAPIVNYVLHVTHTYIVV
jgi:hypothetical protein